MTRSKTSTALIAVGVVALTAAVTPASARRGVALRGAGVAAVIAASAAVAAVATSSAYLYGFGGYGTTHRCRGSGASC
jgi:hypothetical protein